MTPAEVTDLLRYASSLDQWLRQTNPEEGAVMVVGWASILEPVDAAGAMAYVRRHYSEPGARTLTPGDVLGDWHDRRRASAAEETAAAELEARTVPGTLMPMVAVSDYLRDVMEAVRAGLSWDSVARPKGVGRGLTPHADELSRRCCYHTLCACDHKACRDGWLDEPGAVTNTLGRTYEAVQRCPHCLDALKMAEERGIAKKPRRTPVGARR